MADEAKLDEILAILHQWPTDPVLDVLQVIHTFDLGNIAAATNPTPNPSGAIDSFRTVNDEWNLRIREIAPSGSIRINFDPTPDVGLDLSGSERLYAEMYFRAENISGSSSRDAISPRLNLSLLDGTAAVARVPTAEHEIPTDGNIRRVQFDYGRTTHNRVTNGSLFMSNLDVSPSDELRIFVDRFLLRKSTFRTLDDFKADLTPTNRLIDGVSTQITNLDTKLEALDAKVIVIDGSITTLGAKVDRGSARDLNRVVIDRATNRLVVYDTDGTTVLYRKNLLPTAEDATEEDPV